MSIKSFGMIRKVDALGRVTLGAKNRREHNIEPEDYVEVFQMEDGIFIRRKTLRCVICGCREEETLKEIKGVHLCPGCISAIKHD